MKNIIPLLNLFFDKYGSVQLIELDKKWAYRMLDHCCKRAFNELSDHSRQWLTHLIYGRRRSAVEQLKLQDQENDGPNCSARNCTYACKWFALPFSSPEVWSVIFCSWKFSTLGSVSLRYTFPLVTHDCTRGVIPLHPRSHSYPYLCHCVDWYNLS